jgi:hypothetical protein
MVLLLRSMAEVPLISEHSASEAKDEPHGSSLSVSLILLSRNPESIDDE